MSKYRVRGSGREFIVFADSNIQAVKKLKDGLTSAERHNRSMERIFSYYDNNNRKMAEYLANHGVSSSEIEKLKQNTGLHGNALAEKIHKMGKWDDFCSFAGLKDSANIKDSKQIPMNTIREIMAHTKKELVGKPAHLMETIGHHTPSGANWSYLVGYTDDNDLVVTRYGYVMGVRDGSIKDTQEKFTKQFSPTFVGPYEGKKTFFYANYVDDVHSFMEPNVREIQLTYDEYRDWKNTYRLNGRKCYVNPSKDWVWNWVND